MLLDESRNLLNLQVTALLMFIMVKIMTHHRSDHEENCNSKIEHFACVTKAATRMKLMWKSISSSYVRTERPAGEIAISHIPVL